MVRPAPGTAGARASRLGAMSGFDVEAARAALEARHPTWVPRSLHATLEDVAGEHAARPFVIAVDGELSYADLDAWSRRIARGIVAAGVAPGDRVALLLPNSAAFVAAVFAISRAGAIAVPLHSRLHERELAFALRDSGATLLLTVEAFRDAPIGENLDALAPGWHRGGGWVGPAIVGGLALGALAAAPRYGYGYGYYDCPRQVVGYTAWGRPIVRRVCY